MNYNKARAQEQQCPNDARQVTIGVKTHFMDDICG